MGLPISGSRFDRIGKKLGEGLELDDVERDELEQVFIAYDAARQAVQDRLSALGHPPITSRLKTTSTLIDKLHRKPLSIRGIDDLAGVRIVIDGGRLKQDGALEAIKATFSNSDKSPKIHDRRYGSSHGYRAVHVIVYVDKIPVEVQLRTELQHMWAEITEKLGDKWGRGLRYGLGPDSPDSVISEGVTRKDLFDFVQKISDELDHFEEAAKEVSTADHTLKQYESTEADHKIDRSARKRIRKLRDQINQGYDQLVIVEENFRSSLQGLLLVCEQLEG